MALLRHGLPEGDDLDQLCRAVKQEREQAKEERARAANGKPVAPAKRDEKARKRALRARNKYREACQVFRLHQASPPFKEVTTKEYKTICGIEAGWLWKAMLAANRAYGHGVGADREGLSRAEKVMSNARSSQLGTW